MRFNAILMALSAATPMVMSDDPMPYGSVDFPTSCSPKQTENFNTAISLLYSFWYSESLKMFEDIISAEPTCCMAYYGAAMTYNHPVWDFMSDERMEAAEKYAVAASNCANEAEATITTRERDYIYSLGIYLNTTDPALADPATRLKTYADTFNSRVYIPYGPTDENAGIIYGLAVIGVGYYSEVEPQNNFPNLKLAGLVEEMVTLNNENSPGGLHYIIHAYDQPSLAYRSKDAAYQYLTTSVEVPHALHMPSHIFGDLGLWADMIDSNQQSLNLAWANAGEPTGDWYHGSYFMQYGMLQLAMDCDAELLMNSYIDLSEKYTDGFVAEGCVRVPVMYLVETRDWERAAQFDLKTLYPSVSFNSWLENAWALVTSNFVVTAARAILDRPSEEIVAAREAVDLANKILNTDEWKKYQLPGWRQTFDVMVDSAHAWEAFRLTSFEAGITEMEKVVTKQVKSWGPEVAHTWDAREQLSEMLLIRGSKEDIARALRSYEDAIETYPNRYRSLAGAAKCAELLDNDIKASKYYGEVSMIHIIYECSHIQFFLM